MINTVGLDPLKCFWSAFG